MKILAVLLAGPFAILLAPAAHADESAYITELDKYGVPYRSETAAIAFGYQICRQISGGTPVKTLLALGTADGYYSQFQMSSMIGAAVGGLCPYNASTVKAQLGPQ